MLYEYGIFAKGLCALVLGYREVMETLPEPIKSLQVPEVMLWRGLWDLPSPCAPCEERSFAEIDASHGSQDSGAMAAH